MEAGSWAIRVLDWRGGSQWVRHKADYAVGVLKRKWGRSTGTRLLEALEEWALAEGVRRLELGVIADGVRAITLYEKQGYVPEGLKRGATMIDRQPVDEVVMGKLLNIVLGLLLAGCSAASTPSAMTVEVAEMVLTAEPSPTEAACGPWPDGFEMVVSVSSTSQLHIEIEGLLAADTPIIVAEASSVRGGVTVENSYFSPVGDQGSFSDGLASACPDALRGERASWDIRVIHSRGVSCIRAEIDCP